MLFNSLDFAVFLPIIFSLYWLCNKNLKIQNLIVTLGSYVFYGWWDWRFLSLIVFSTCVDYTVGRCLGKQRHQVKRKTLLWVSIIVNLGLLGFFKYYNFFLESFVSAFSFFGYEINSSGLNVILPVGISFYTFQTLSYTIDVYRRRLEPTRDYVAFSAFVSFFPQLVAGPIERATHLLPQFDKKRTFKYEKAEDGLRQILWGLFKKLVIADNCAIYANTIFNDSANQSGSTLVLGAVFFAFQIYGDFSGYSDIAIGTARLFGFQLMRNFAYPYFSRDIAEFWRRWHISLSSWFKDYLYIPLGGSRGGAWFTMRNTFAIFVVSGFWHGANWTFVIWGALNACYYLPYVLLGRNRRNIDVVAENSLLPSFREICGIISTFVLTTFAWIFFRARDLSHAVEYISGIFSKTLMVVPDFKGRRQALVVIVLIVVFVSIEFLGRKDQHPLVSIKSLRFGIARWFTYYLIGLFIFLFAAKQQTFIYFQF